MSTKEVDDWFRNFDHPLKSTMLAVRGMILRADPRMDECIKWQSPTFTYEGNLASFNPRAKKHVSLMFHTGAKIPGNFPHLQGGGGTAKYMTFADENEAAARRGELERIVAAWIISRGGTTLASRAKVKSKTGAKSKTKRSTASGPTAKKQSTASKKKSKTAAKKTTKKKAATGKKKKTAKKR